MALSEAEATMAAHAEIFKGLVPTVIKDNVHLFLPVDDPRKWQPNQMLPDVAREGKSAWEAKCEVLRTQAQTISKPLRVVFAGNMVTENGLAQFADALASKLRPLEIIVGTSDNPLAESRRRWYGDEDRHARVTYGYANLSGVYDMQAIDRTINIFHVNGFDNEVGLDLYTNLLFVVKQEKFTEIAHKRTGQLAKKQQEEAGLAGESFLYKVQTVVSKDETIHHVFYKNIFDAIVTQDPEGAVIAFRDLIKTGLLMPARFMGDIDGHDQVRSSTLFEQYGEIGSTLGILTLMDDYEVDEEFIGRWDIAHLPLSGEAAIAQDEILRRHAMKKRLAQRYEDRREEQLKQNNGQIDVSAFKWLTQAA